MEDRDSTQIEVIRVFCIVSMMWAHVSPSLSVPSVVSGGSYDWLGNLLGYTLGRVSVTTLSFISGFLLWQNRQERRAVDLIRRRFGAVMVPMLAWSAIFLMLAVGKEVVLNHPSTALRNLGTDPRGLFNAWTGLGGPMANDSLLFLRDLFVATVLLCLAGRALDRAPLPVAALVLAVTLGQLTAPLIFRPSILFFMTLGALASRGGLTVGTLSRPALALPAGFILIATEALLAYSGGLDSALVVQGVDLLRRASVGAFVLVLTGTGMKLFPVGPVARLGRHSFLAYLSHASVIGVFWVAWTMAVGDENAPSYLAFYLAAPFLAFALAVIAGTLLDRAPRVLQLLLRGRAGRDRRVPFAVGSG
ncbi:MAG: acyltransferase [Proteobacteria bacterium]|nr:acyltransferase [Pseudomonadota bacterium]